MNSNAATQLPTPRSVGLQGAPNFRDLGGYITTDGRRVRTGRLFRSSHLGALTGADHAAVARLGLRAICDLRGGGESAAAPPAAVGTRVRPCPIEPAIVPRLRAAQASGRQPDGAAVANLMEDVYRDYVRSWAGAFRSLFEALLADEAPLVFHCTAGKDRTGVAAALVLSALSVPRATVLHDYMLSRLFWREEPKAHPGFSADVVRVAGSVQERFLAAAFQVIDVEHGGIAGYLHDAIGLRQRDRLALADSYLERA